MRSVCNDRPLRTWVLGFGGTARVVSPKSLAGEILGEIQAARERYMPKLKFEMLRILPPSFDSLSLAQDGEGGSHVVNKGGGNYGIEKRKQT